jgi:Flp pilus assembly protein TadD
VYPEYHEGAADRALAGLYQHAPRLISVGDSGKAVFHANEAVRIGPGYPGNHLVRADVLAEQGDHEGARAAVARARSLLDRFGSDPNIAYWKGEIERLGQ